MNPFKKPEDVSEKLQYRICKAAELLDMSARKLTDLANEGVIPSHTIGRNRYITYSALKEFLNMAKEKVVIRI